MSPIAGRPPAPLDLAAGHHPGGTLCLLPRRRRCCARAGSGCWPSPTRSAPRSSPHVPTAAEAGIPADGGGGRTRPVRLRGMPAPLRDELAAQVAAVLADPAAAARLRAAGMEPRAATTPEAFVADTRAIASTGRRWRGPSAPGRRADGERRMTEDGFLAGLFPAHRVCRAGCADSRGAAGAACPDPAAIPFEGLDPFLGRPVAIDAPRSRRSRRTAGAAAIATSRTHFSSACWRQSASASPPARRPRGLDDAGGAPHRGTHRLTLVELPEGPCLCRCWFRRTDADGAARLEPGLAQAMLHGTFRVMREEANFAAELRLPAAWEPLYRFRLEPHLHGGFRHGDSASPPRIRAPALSGTWWRCGLSARNVAAC